MAIPGSAPRHLEGAHSEGMIRADLSISATIVLRRRPGAPDLAESLLSGSAKPLAREEAGSVLDADPADIDAVKHFARENGLNIETVDQAARTIKVRGNAAAFNQAFGIELGSFGNSLSYQGPLTVPKSLAGVVVAVLGLDTRAIARPR